MKWQFNRKPTGLIGLHRAGDTAHAVAMMLDGDELRTVATADGTGDVLARLGDDVRDWPVAVTLPPQAGLHRALDLPATADDAALARMIALRLESLYPVEDATLRTGHARAAAGPTWVYVAAGSAIDQHTPALPSHHPLGGAASMEMATLALLLQRDPRTSAVIIAGNEAHAGVAVVIDGKLHGIELADLGGDDAQDLAALDEALHASTDDLDEARKPATLIVVGDVRSRARELASRWGMTIGDPGERDEGSALARGTATAVLRKRVPALAFELVRVMPVEQRRELRRRVAWAGGWLVAAVLAMAAVDLRNASKLEQQQIDTVMSGDERAQLESQRQLGNYLQQLGPTPLGILDEIGQVTRDIQLDDVRYDIGGEFRLRGKQRSTETINQLINALSKMQTLENVTLVSQRSAGRDEVEFEITAKANRRFFQAYVPPAAPPREAQAQRTDRTASTGAAEATP